MWTVFGAINTVSHSHYKNVMNVKLYVIVMHSIMWIVFGMVSIYKEKPFVAVHDTCTYYRCEHGFCV